MPAKFVMKEQRHNELVYVEAIVFTVPAKPENIGEETTEEDICYFRRNRFEGNNSKLEAARYAHRLKQDIDHLFLKSQKLNNKKCSDFMLVNQEEIMKTFH